MFKITYIERFKAPVSDEEYSQICSMLGEAVGKSSQSLPVVELEQKTGAAKIKKQIAYVAEKEGMNLSISRRGLRLVLKFRGEKASGRRMNDQDAAKLVLEHLQKSGDLQARGDVAEALQITPIKASKALKALHQSGKVVAEGQKPKLKYRAK
jgi:hypothetical protein